MAQPAEDVGGEGGGDVALGVEAAEAADEEDGDVRGGGAVGGGSQGGEGGQEEEGVEHAAVDGVLAVLEFDWPEPFGGDGSGWWKLVFRRVAPG